MRSPNLMVTFLRLCPHDTYNAEKAVKLTAIDSHTGIVLLETTGLSEEALAATAKAAFPNANVVIRRDSPAKAPDRTIVWKGPFYDLGGYSGMNREICIRLRDMGLGVAIRPTRTPRRVDAEIEAQLRAMETAAPERAPVVLGYVPTPTSGGRTAFFTMTETQSPHDAFVARCNRFADEVWVPSSFCRQSMERAGVRKPVHVIPLGVDPEVFRPGATAPDVEYEELPTGRRTRELPSCFRFVSVFEWGYRKGPDVLCESFLRAFGDEACLVVYSRQRPDIRREILSHYAATGSTARIFHCGDAVPRDQMPGCYASCDAFVLCSRGEGFGLPVAEAAACGLPVLASYNTGLTEYLDDEVAFLVRPDGLEEADGRATSFSEFYRGQTFCRLGPRAVAEFSRQMREMVSDRQAARLKADALRLRVTTKYTWDACAARVAERLGGMF
jgi:hypothetical protein